MRLGHLRVGLALAMLTLTSPVAAGPEDSPAVSEELPLSFERRHSLGRTQAIERVKQMLEYWQGRFGIRSEWRENTASVSGTMWGVPIRARLVVQEDGVLAKASDPGPVLRGSAVKYIQDKLSKYLHPTYEEP